ncbi:MAG: tRNA (adenosine(37)-N6)-threonylcarbamoyltransferase complex dimerization subunit type 1 TsaB [Clostridia bacterium]|nr:tRNA (adenosine(37)-N6)-threonylcarbamoyltransferase complex dimerization subunit type 1 TsaB [Clostridia bacterium]
MKLLAISTSSRMASVALSVCGRMSCAVDESGSSHSSALMPLVDRLLCENSLAVRDVDAFAVDVGPGSFTGVRIGVSAANAMAYALAKPVYAVSSLEALRFAAPDGVCVCALLDCRNGNGYAALYDGGSELKPPCAVVISEFLHDVPEKTVFVGDGAQLHREAILAAVPGASVIEGVCVSAHGAVMAVLNGCYRECSGGAVPMYLRKPQAERLRSDG